MTSKWKRDFLRDCLQVDLVDDDLIASLPETIYSITYYKPPKSLGLIARNIPDSDDPQSAIKLSEFLAGAWLAANDKARELGWIV
jgi:hypothetical protein